MNSWHEYRRKFYAPVFYFPEKGKSAKIKAIKNKYEKGQGGKEGNKKENQNVGFRKKCF